nr:PREDICTED: alcohol dehydrogenase-like 5 [Daucus carota subsp. sativus]
MLNGGGRCSGWSFDVLSKYNLQVTSGRWRIAALNKHDKPRVGSGASNITEGTFFGNYKPRNDILGVVEKYMNKEMVVEKFSTHKVNLSDINKAFDYMIRGKAQRHRHRCLGKANILEA